MERGFSDSVSPDVTGAEGLNFQALVGATLHQIRILCGQEMTAGMMFYFVHNDEHRGSSTVPTHYLPDARLAYFESVKFLEVLLKPYRDEAGTKKITTYKEKIDEIEKSHREYWAKETTAYWCQSTANGKTRGENRMYNDITQDSRPIYDERFEDCITLLHKLNLLPKTLTSKEHYKKENVI